MEIKGKVHEVSEVMNVTDTFRKRELVVEFAENPQYPEYVKFEAIQDRVSLMDNLKVGDDVEVAFNLKGRPWTDKSGKKQYFNTLQVWKVTVLGADAGAPAQTPQFAAPVDISAAPEADDDLPF
ncbi:hypothetical protein PBAC_26900 [Pedobacter glucosidilyticus]|uniref:DUF3127 domain-containing protein n=1 Tax=Pedobacter aquae TaxID=2605747 RepID=A0A5C0VIJ0_9SPHI|nr:MULTISPECIES: DUF3127 domain-containing protein [Pedobacter]KHJ37155.1 hypothetical protein PBAC_26900 [Pedobacter glucosidilyticus]QEK52548.1 DUF3127 domain-containing protein [Pedobacter aquae]